MLTMVRLSLAVILFVCCYVSVRHLLQLALHRRGAKGRLAVYRMRQVVYEQHVRKMHDRFFYRHMHELLQSVRFDWQVESFLLMMLVAVCCGVSLGAFYFQSVKGVIVLAFLCCCLPYLWLRLRLISMQMRTRIDFLPAVEVFYQTYVLARHSNLHTVLKEAVQGTRIRYPMNAVFTQLYRNLATHRDAEQSLRIFSLALGNLWAGYFVSIMRIGMQEGIDIADNLHELIVDMRRAQRADQAARNRLLEIRIANFTPIVFLGLFLFVNFQINYHNAYRYYVLEPAGRDLLLNSCLLIFASFLMGIVLSMKRS